MNKIFVFLSVFCQILCAFWIVSSIEKNSFETFYNKILTSECEPWDSCDVSNKNKK